MFFLRSLHFFFLKEGTFFIIIAVHNQNGREEPVALMNEQLVAGKENLPAQACGVWASPREQGEPRR